MPNETLIGDALPSIDIATGKLAYRVEGDGPPLVLLHANLHDGSDFDAVVPVLAEDFSVYVPDFPGHGGSAAPGEAREMSAALCADALEEFVDALELRDVALLGSSVGGFAAGRLALRRPGSVSALVLVQSAGFTGASPKVRVASRLFGSAWMQRRMARRLPQMYMRPSGDADRALVARVAARARTAEGSQRSAAMWRSFGRAESDLRDHAGEISTPTLVVWGTRDRIRPVAEGVDLARLVPGARLVTLPTGHLPFLTDPEGFLAEVRPFLRDSARGRWRSPLLGERRSLALEQGPLDYYERGEGPVVVFAHGWLANANLWRKVVDLLADRFRCIALDLPLGSHRRPLGADADLSPRGCGALISDALDALDLDDVTLVGNDSGGAYSQIATASSPDRVARLVLNSCETPYDEFPPPPFDGLPSVARDEGQLGSLLGALRDPDVRASDAAYGLLIKHPIDTIVSDSYALPPTFDRAILRDTSKVMAAAVSLPVHEAGRRLIETLAIPVLFAWSPEDRVFPIENARRYAAALSQARVESIEDAYSFTPEDQPERLAAAIAAFVPG